MQMQIAVGVAALQHAVAVRNDRIQQRRWGLRPVECQIVMPLMRAFENRSVPPSIGHQSIEAPLSKSGIRVRDP